LRATPVGAATADAWPVAGRDTVDLPVYHWWTFRTGKAGTFEELARRLRFTPAAAAGLGTRTIDVGRPWPAEEPLAPATVAMDGALRAPGTAAPETWTDPTAQDRFRALLGERLDAPARRREEIVEEPADGQEEGDGQGAEPVGTPDWMSTLNLEVRRRVAAALGTRYVQLEQEFLMARAWEQVGEIRQANRMLAAGELAAVAAERAQHKHLDPLGVADLVTVMAPVSGRVHVAAPQQDAEAPGVTLAGLLASADKVPTGAADTSFVRLTRTGGALARRVGRVTEPDAPVPEPVLVQGLMDMGMNLSGDADNPGLPVDLRRRIDPMRLQVLRMTDRIPADFWARRDEDDRPLRPIMAHPRFTVPIAEELLARWPEWALPGISALPPDSVTLLETNPEFIAATLVGLNHEFNRELLWREFPTDQRGTPFARFWPGDDADVEEIALWSPDAPLGSHLRTGGAGNLVLLVRGELLRRFPGTALLAVRGVGGELPPAFDGVTATPLALDESTVLYLFAGLDAARARAEDWFFVFREPMRGTQFGFDSGTQPAQMKSWADLTWEGVRVAVGASVLLGHVPPQPTPPADEPPPPDPPVWGRDAADMARIAFQQPFQLAFRATALLGG
ncbi:hypothetical protein, partial [Streptomyces resistomycificus]|uniref:hypothetical protein n=1 Tax=Streptomyces resistomycificus TaxID=67356 RepID=UPI0007C54642